ncbi:penicillin-binding transpeptidase domain-containing protein [Gudongella sp. SC589]|uniref:penicillin-binding transpeptidase domain-containing protein n=1 Tax=Gudongella sp. SC589 TaxID=3385990 RepID=UPI003904DE69
MKLREKLFNRYSLMIYILVLIVTMLVFRLATLTIAQGDYYRDLSDNKRVKEIYTTAPRGEIRDRHGRLLAGNVPTFTVQLLKDELNIGDRSIRNESLLQLVRLLETDGAEYVNDYPVELNYIKYSSIDSYLSNEDSPMDKLVKILLENSLLNEFLTMEYSKPYNDHFGVTIFKRAQDVLSDKNPDIYSLDGESPEDVVRIAEMLSDDKVNTRKIVDHPVARLLAYELLQRYSLQEDIKIDEYALTYYEDYVLQKTGLMAEYPFITMKTSGEEDFINLFNEVGMYSFLSRAILLDDETNEYLIPGEILIEVLEDNGVSSPVQISIGDNGTDLLYSFADTTGISDQDPLEHLIETAKDKNILHLFIKDERIRYQAQSHLINSGVNPRISVAGEIEYVHINNMNNWYEANRIEKGTPLKEAFEAVREIYSIDENISPYESRSLLGLINQLNIQGYLAYQPINIAYGIKDETVAKIEEGLSGVPGINVSIEPVRIYPEGTTASHILGYIGKISQPFEIEKYIREEGYSPGTLIGKTGIEESFQLQLNGQSGVKKVEVDVIGNTTNVIEEIIPVPGDNIYLSIDLKLQKTAEEAMEHTLEQLSKGGTFRSDWGDFTFGTHRRKGRPYINANSGAVVVLDVKTGETLAMVSYPSYDPNLFSTGINNTDWLSLFPEDSDNPLAARPLYNIATQTAVQPGSTFKMVTGLTALEKGLNPLLRIRDMGYVTVGDKRFHCLIYTNTGGTHGYENFYEALRDSCNYYFYTLALGRNQRTGQDIGVKIEIEDIVDMSKKLGLNDKTGIEINIPTEVSGGVPDPQRKIITTKYLLKQMLQRIIEGYLMEEREFSDEEVNDAIDEIISWTELEETLSRAEVVRRLYDMGIEPEMRLPGEREGLADKIKYTYLNQAGWNISDTLNVTIGQGQSAYTPIQMANYISTIANGGYLNKVTLIDSIRNYNNVSILYEHQPQRERIELNDYENLEHVKVGMEMVADDGTARRIFQNFPVQVGVKTGTAERSGINPSTGDTFDDFAWFVGFAPYDDPEIAVAAVLFQGGSGGYAAPMVREIIAEYLGLNDVEQIDTLPIENSITFD